MRIKVWWDWLRGRSGLRLPRLRVVLYTRRGCHLCDDAWGLLAAEQRRCGFQLEAVDVDGTPGLAELYGEQVPVVAVGGTIRFRGGVNRVLLRRLLRAEANRKPTHGGPRA